MPSCTHFQAVWLSFVPDAHTRPKPEPLESEDDPARTRLHRTCQLENGEQGEGRAAHPDNNGVQHAHGRKFKTSRPILRALLPTPARNYLRIVQDVRVSAAEALRHMGSVGTSHRTAPHAVLWRLLAHAAALVLGVHVVTWLPARPHPVSRPWAPPPLGTAPMTGRAVPRHRRLPSRADAPPLAGCGGESQSLAASLRAPAEAAQTAEKVTEEKSDGRRSDRARRRQC